MLVSEKHDNDTDVTDFVHRLWVGQCFPRNGHECTFGISYE